MIKPAKRKWHEEQARGCIDCSESHDGECQTVRLIADAPMSEYHREADRFPARAPEGPFRLGGRKRR